MWSDRKAADEAGDAVLAAVLASELLKLTPKSYYSWFQAGLLSKALGNFYSSYFTPIKGFLRSRSIPAATARGPPHFWA
ncbi:hypothetical protein J2809_002833 [Arthrobacter pascens]|nr:hypothetical protein [Arthrobacter pascens]